MDKEHCKETDHSPEAILEKGGIRPTANRILVIRELLSTHNPLSMTDLEDRLETLEKSSIFRVLTLLLEHGLVHAIEDGRGIVKYEICHGHGHCTINDMHPHFYCENCLKVFCLEEIPLPEIALPDGFEVKSVNYMLKGLCPECSRKGQDL